MMSVRFHSAADALTTALQRLLRRRTRRDVEIAGQDHALQPLARIRCGLHTRRRPTRRHPSVAGSAVSATCHSSSAVKQSCWPFSGTQAAAVISEM